MSNTATPTRSPPATTPRARLLPLPLDYPADWASAYGEDRFGLWQAFDVAGVQQVMRWIPPGGFLMGSPKSEPERRDNERQHPVRLTQGHWLADTACTQALWAAVMDGANPSDFKNHSDNPVERVSWANVVSDFLPRLNAQLPGLQACLPTEAQWEYACRADAAINTPFGFGGQITSQQVNFDGHYPMPGSKKSEYRERTVPVTALPCNAWGLYQMHGNVWEWCADWYAPYPVDPAQPEAELVDPAGPAQAPEAAWRVLRGGCWIFGARYCRSAMRYVIVPGLRNHFIGFRLARAAS